MIDGNSSEIYEGNPTLNPYNLDTHFYLGTMYDSDKEMVREAIKNFYLGRGSVDYYYTDDKLYNYNSYKEVYNVRLK